MKKLFFLLCLSAAPLVYPAPQVEVLSWSPRIFTVDNFLSSEECDRLISLGKDDLEPSLIVDVDNEDEKGILDGGRTSMGTFFDTDDQDPLLQTLEKRLSLLTMMPHDFGEEIQMVHYDKGQQFVPHHDYYDADTVAGKRYIEEGGQRLVTVIMYLNEPTKGGETYFPEAKVKVTPKKGKAVIFYDCHPDGRIDPATLHQGMPVVEGEKWIATKWYCLSKLRNRD